MKAYGWKGRYWTIHIAPHLLSCLVLVFNSHKPMLNSELFESQIEARHTTKFLGILEEASMEEVTFALPVGIGKN